MKIFSAVQLKKAEAYTIEKDSITSTDLMERAAKAVADEVCYRWSSVKNVKIFAGPGNNG